MYAIIQFIFYHNLIKISILSSRISQNLIKKPDRYHPSGFGNISCSYREAVSLSEPQLLRGRVVSLSAPAERYPSQNPSLSSEKFPQGNFSGAGWFLFQFLPNGIPAR